MLGKIMKHEFRSTGRILGVLLLFMAVMTAIGCLSFRAPMWMKVMANKTAALTPADILGVLALLLYIFSLIGALWGAGIYLGFRFYRSMYAEEGYLTHTLPVSCHKLLTGKILVGGVWYLAIVVVAVLSITALMASLFGAATAGGAGGLWSELTLYLDEIDESFRYSMGVDFRTYLILILTMALTGAFVFIVILYGSVTLGQLSSRHKVMMSIVCYFAVTTVIQMLGAAATMPVAIANTIRYAEHPGMSASFNFIGCIVLMELLNLTAAVVLYFVSHHIITWRLNLD